MSFLALCSPCFRNCCKRNAYERVEPAKTKKRTQSAFEVIEMPTKEDTNGKTKGTQQPLLGGGITAHNIRQKLDEASSQASSFSQHSGKPPLAQVHRRSLPPFPSPKKRPYYEHDEEIPEDLKSLPLLKFSILYDSQYQSATVTLLEAYNLPTEGKKRCNPFAAVYFIPNNDKMFSSKVLFDTTNPMWIESFTFPNVTLEFLQKQTLVFRLYNKHGESESVLIGMTLLPLAEAELLGVPIQMVIKKEGAEFEIDRSGGLHLALEHLPDQGILHGTVLRAHNLKKRGLRQRDPYVKLVLLYKGQRIFKWKTSIKTNTLLPIYNESFNFSVSGLDMGDITLKAMIMDHVKVGKDEHLGTVLIGAGVEQKSGRNHWNRVVESPNETKSFWHMLTSESAS